MAKCLPMRSQSRVQAKRKRERERGGREFREDHALSDENDDTTAIMQVIGRKNARLGVNAIKSQIQVSRNPEQERRIKAGFLDTDKIHRMKQDKMELLSASNSKTFGIPLKNPKRVRVGSRKNKRAARNNRGRRVHRKELGNNKKNLSPLSKSWYAMHERFKCLAHRSNHLTAQNELNFAFSR